MYQLSDIGPIIGPGLGLELELHKNLKNIQPIYEGLTDIHEKFQHVRLHNV